MAPPPPPPPPPQRQAPSPPSLEDLTARRAASLLLPWIRVAYAAADTSREITVFVDQVTGSVTIIEGSDYVESFLSEVLEKEGFVPASKASIESLPVVKVTEPFSECPICLAEFQVNEEVKQMPCNHKFHSGCIDKWLGIHGSCPYCRYKMPKEEDEEEEEEEEEEEPNGDEEMGRAGEIRIHMFLLGNRSRGSGGRYLELGHHLAGSYPESDSHLGGDEELPVEMNID